jgi:hypothetical protein
MVNDKKCVERIKLRQIGLELPVQIWEDGIKVSGKERTYDDGRFCR